MMNACRVMFESGPHKPVVEVASLRLRICEIVQDYDEKVQILVQDYEDKVMRLEVEKALEDEKVQGLVQDYEDKVKKLEVERAALKEGAVKIVQDYDEKVQGLVQDFEDKVKRLEAEKTGLQENAAKAVKDTERAERLVKYYEDEVENLEVEKEGLMEDALKWREKKDELGSLVEEFKEKLKKLEIEKEDAANWREEKAELEIDANMLREEKAELEMNANKLREEKSELEKDVNKLREEKAELTTTKVELQLALRQVLSPNVYNCCNDRFPVGLLLHHSLLISFRLLKANGLDLFFMEVSLAPLQERLLILKKNKKKRTENIREGKESPMKDMQARTKSLKHEGQNHQGEVHGWKRRKSPVDASPLLGRFQKDGKRKFTETNFEENERKMKKVGRKRAKTDIEKANAQNSKFLCPECERYFKNWRDCRAHCLAKKHDFAKDGQWLQRCRIRHKPESCGIEQEKVNVVERLSSDRKLNPDEAEENTDQYMDGEDWLSQGFETHVFYGEAPPPAPSIWVRKEIFKPEVLHYNNNIIVSSVNLDFEPQ